MKCLVYTFFNYHKVTSKSLYEAQIDVWDKLFLNGRNLQSGLIKKLKDYDFVIGLADHNKNAKDGRLDPLYVNRNGRKKILLSGPEEYFSNWDLELPSGFYRFSSFSNGPCNRSAYLAMHEIAAQNLKTKFVFFHLPKTYNTDKLEEFLAMIFENICLTIKSR